MPLFSTTLLLATALLPAEPGHREVVHLDARALTEVGAGRRPLDAATPRFVAEAKFAGQLGLDAWLGADFALFSAAGSRDATALADRLASAAAELAPLVANGRAVGERLFVFHVERAASYERVLDHLGECAPPAWEPLLREARGLPGVELADARSCAIVDDDRGASAMRRSNLLVHLASHLLLDAACGALPEWVREGAALDVEQRLCGSLLAFCRGGTRALAPTRCDWRATEQRAWKDAGEKAFDGVLAMDGREFDETKALRAATTVRWLREQRADAFVRAIERLREDGDLGTEAQRAAFALEFGARWTTEWLAGASGHETKGRRSP
jgi:hypothetical protein